MKAKKANRNGVLTFQKEYEIIEAIPHKKFGMIELQNVSNLQVNVYLLFIRIRSGIKSLVSESVDNPQLSEITRDYSRALKRKICRS